MKKRMISMMLCICILLSLVPVTALATEPDETAQPRMIYLDNSGSITVLSSSLSVFGCGFIYRGNEKLNLLGCVVS